MDRSDDLLVTFWGTRGSVPTPGRATEKYGGNTSCLEIQHKGKRVILDAGTGIRNLGIELSAHKEKSEDLDLTLLISHTHWDHIQGLPFFTPAYLPSTKLTIWGNTNREHELAQILGGQMIEEYFPVNMTMLGADIQFKILPPEGIEVGDMKITWQQQHYHPGGSVRFAVEAGGKRFVYSSDIELEAMFRPDEQTETSMSHKEEYLAFIDGADLLVADGQYTQEEYQTKIGWGHTAVPLVLEVADMSKVKRLALFHHEPLYSDRKIDEIYVKYQNEYHAKNSELDFFWAREGVTLAV